MFKITQIREDKGMSKSELSRRSQIVLPVISQLESGKIYPYPGWKNKLAEALETDPDILFVEVEEKENVKNRDDK